MSTPKKRLGFKSHSKRNEARNYMAQEFAIEQADRKTKTENKALATNEPGEWRGVELHIPNQASRWTVTRRPFGGDPNFCICNTQDEADRVSAILNSHDALVSALRECRAALENANNDPLLAVKQADAALKAAGVEL
jgi:hypothetical protein